MGMIYIIPEPYSAEQVEQLVGHEWSCPYCGHSSTREKGLQDIQWINTPLRVEGPRFICCGCAIDIYILCNSEVFKDSPSLYIVEDAARREDLSVELFRKRCLLHQLDVLKGLRKKRDQPDYASFERRLEELLKTTC